MPHVGSHVCRLSLVISFALAPSPTASAGTDLAKEYPATLTWSGQGLPYRCDATDVFALKSFELELGDEFTLECRKATLALGVHETNVLWAAVFPEQPAELNSPGNPGDGEPITSICLRFPPGEVGQVFPARTVKGQGETLRRFEALELFRHKIGHKWFTPAGFPTVVQPGFVLVDVDNADGQRRFFELDRNANTVTYVPDFEANPTPPRTPIDEDAAEAAFEEVWSAFDAEYANFVGLDLDWKKAGKRARKQLAAVAHVEDLGGLLAETLAQLEDLHVWVRLGDRYFPGFQRERPLLGSYRGSLAQLESHEEAGRNLTVGRTSDGIGYLNVHGLGDPELASHVDRALEQLADTWAMVVDLRFNGGGDELLARAVAGRFVDEPRVYATNRYRNGPKHEQFGDVLERVVEPRGPWRYGAPLAVLQGQRTMSSAESFALMLAQCPGATTMGDRTAGSSANPRRLELECGLEVNLPRWHDMDPDQNPIERVGVPPDVPLEFPIEAFTDERDPVLEAALRRLRKTPGGERRAGRAADEPER